MTRLIVGLIMILSALLGGYLLEGGNPWSLLGFTSFLIVFFIPFFGVLSVWSLSTWGAAFRHAFAPAPLAPAAQRSIQLWAFVETSAYLAGILGLVIGAILILGNQIEVTAATINPFRAMAAGLVPLIYGLVFGLIAKIFRARIQDRLV